jgi:thiol-disulfide isomerase/thioredoxin
MKMLLIPLFVLGCMCSSAQNAKQILKTAYDRCQSIQSGYYEMIHSQKYMSGEDTVSSAFNCYFKKLADDTLYASAFHYQSFYGGERKRDVLYSGEEFVNYSVADSTGEIMVKAMWAEDIDAYSHNYTFYDPLFTRDSSPLPDPDDLEDGGNSFRYLGSEEFLGSLVHHIEMNVTPENEPEDMMQMVKAQFHFWIDQKSFLPVRHTIMYELVMGGDTMVQYENIELIKFDADDKDVEEQISMTSIPDFIVLKDYVPYKSPEPLPVDTIAPEWKLISLTDDSVSLSALKGSIVVVDFFYKSCYPCMQALPALQSLHERYADQGLKMIGIDPFDTKEEDKIDEFLAKRGVTYTVLLGGKEAAKEYRVSGYPTLYVIGKDGKVLFTQIGYGEGTEVELEEVIKAHL